MGGQLPPPKLIQKPKFGKAQTARPVNISPNPRKLKKKKYQNYIKFYKSMSKMFENSGKANPGWLGL